MSLGRFLEQHPNTMSDEELAALIELLDHSGQRSLGRGRQAQRALQRRCRRLENGEKALYKLTLSRINDRVHRVLVDQGEHVGNLKFINGVWKFKAIGYDKNGDVIPGGGPLTDRHNTTFGALDVALINAKLGPDLRN